MVFVERQQQLAHFSAALADCQSGNGRLLAVTGPMASGKSTLLDVFAELAHHQGFHVLRAAGSRTERELPLSLVSQLCHDLGFVTDEAGRNGLLREVRDTAFRHDRASAVPGPRLAAVVHNATVALLAAGGSTPVLLAVDDLQHVDALSLNCLLYLVRRIRASRVLVVLSGGELVDPTDPQLYADLMEQASDNHLLLPPLSPAGVRELIADAFGQRPGDAVADACTRVSGGNPLLARTLIADLTDSARTGILEESDVRPGRAYASALRRYVERSDPVIRRVLAAVALIDECRPDPVLPIARLADVDAAAARRALAGLEFAGLIRDGRLPHPLAVQAVLDQLPAPALTDLHLRAALLLHEEGSAPRPIARHLLAAGQVPGWSGPVLGAAAEELLANGEIEPALALLRLAHDAATDDEQRIALKVALLQTEWRVDPAVAGHRLVQLTAAARAGRLSPLQRVATVRCLFWLGRTTEAIEMLDGLRALEVDAGERAEISFLLASLRYTHPGLTGDEPTGSRPAERSPEAVVNTREALAHALETVMTKGPNSFTVVAAEQALQRAPLAGGAPPVLAAALTVLIHADHLETAVLWTDRLLNQTRERGASSWRAMLTGIRSDIALRSGQLADAQRHAEAALGMMSPESWSDARGVPLSVALLALVGRGRLEEAGRLLEQPVPDSMFDTVFALSYLQARGTYYLATARPEAALEDFLTCWDLTAKWNVDLPTIAPWRIHAARAQLALGRAEEARALVESQLTQLGPEPSRTKAAALRVLAATVPLAQRPTLLREGAEISRACGDRLELAHTLADLSQAQKALGDFQRARMTVRRACDLATDCQADELRRRLLPDIDDTAVEGDDENDAEAFNSLSDAERRVAALAAQGSTNRQIANKLFVTVSTVEQHLTKVYRKLNVNRRADLLIRLGPRIGNVA